MKVYISGKITGNPNFIEQFEKAETRLKKKGYDVVNPAITSNLSEYFDYADFIITSLMLIKKCQAVYFLANWEDSVGSKIEKEVARKLGLRLLHEKYFGRVRSPRIHTNQIEIGDGSNEN